MDVSGGDDFKKYNTNTALKCEQEAEQGAQAVESGRKEGATLCRTTLCHPLELF